MRKTYKLKNTIKHYEWGSPVLIPEFLGVENPNKSPFAEMWMGTHIGAPSFTEESPLIDTAGDLPFLLKLLAVDKPLSIQAHPDKEKAAEGFYLEEELKNNIKSPTRNYKDPNPKPEMLCALSDFSLMAGFREFENIDALFLDFIKEIPQLKEIFLPLKKSLKLESLAVFFRILFDLSKFEKEYICDLVLKKDIKVQSNIITNEQWELMKKFAHLYPDDPAILSPLYLNLIALKPGDVIYIPPGILHSYLSGFGVELMNASDNVLRGGLTPKYVDIPELMRIVNFKPIMPKIDASANAPVFNCNFEDLSLLILKNDGASCAYSGFLPAICLVTDGELFAEEESFKKGESFFIPVNSENLAFKGKFSAFFAASASSVLE